MYRFYPPENNFNYFVIYDDVLGEKYFSDKAVDFSSPSNTVSFRLLDKTFITINLLDIDLNNSLPAIQSFAVSDAQSFFNYINQVYNIPNPSKYSLNYKLNFGFLVQQQFLFSEIFNQSFSFNNSIILLYPLLLKEDISFNFIGFKTGDQSGTNEMNFSIYDSDDNLFPGKAILNWNQGIAEINDWQYISVPLSLSKGIKWFAVSTYSGRSFRLFGENGVDAQKVITNQNGTLKNLVYPNTTPSTHPTNLTGQSFIENYGSVTVPVFVFTNF